MTVGGSCSGRREGRGEERDGTTCGSGVVWELFQNAQEGILDIIQKKQEREDTCSRGF